MKLLAAKYSPVKMIDTSLGSGKDANTNSEPEPELEMANVKEDSNTEETFEGTSDLRRCTIDKMNNLSQRNNRLNIRSHPIVEYKDFYQYEDDWTSSSSSSSDDVSDEDTPWSKAKRKKKAKKSKSIKGQAVAKKPILLTADSKIDWENSPLLIQKILAYKELTKAQWSKKMGQMNTRLVTCGSMWQVEKKGNKRERREAGRAEKDALCSDDSNDVDANVGRYLIRWKGLSYLHVTWELYRDIEEHMGINGTQYVSRFRKKYGEILLRGELSPEEEWGGGFFNPECIEIDRVLKVVRKPGTDTELVIKWLGCSYSELSYETVSDLDQLGINHKDAVSAYFSREDVRARKKLLQEAKNGTFQYPTLSPNFENKGKLRDYQLVGVKWMLANWAGDRSCILADEMGLGKTLQSMTAVWWLFTKAGQSGPCLVVAPLSTLHHWKRETEEWTGLSTVLYHGSQSDRDVILEYEMFFAQEAKGKPVIANGERLYKPQVIITTPGEVIQNFLPFKDITFSMLIVDEAQRLKNSNASLNKVLTQDVDWESCILLTGTPIQNNLEELWSLMNFVDPHVFDDKEGFISKYGDMTRTEQVSELNLLIRPYILRRMKEDVEKKVPPKQETIVEVELTAVQKQYYRALYEQNTEFLLQGGIRNGPSLMNLAIELRKCCNHPYLVKGAEEAIHTSNVIEGSEIDKLIMSSGKMVLLDKILPHLKKQGHRVLIFSQFVMVLDVLDDYLRGRNYVFGRIDGSIIGVERQRAIDRFQAPGSDLFIMLLSTRAGGQGINLTAADTVIIYDSDWNPQNDIQAQARCHRIGQTKNVKVYRLLTNKTYEQVMFQAASRKLGLDQAIIQHEQRKSNSLPQLSSKEVETLLKHGAYAVLREDENNDDSNKSKVFFEESIDSILSRSEVRSHGCGGDMNGNDANGSNAFSKASFISKENTTVDIDDPEFWVKVVGLKVPEKKLEGMGLGKRTARAAVDYTEQVPFGGGEGRKMTSDFHCPDDESIRSSDLSSSDDEFRSDAEAGPNGMVDDWTFEDLESILKQLLLLGYGRDKAIAIAMDSERRPEEIHVVCVAVVVHMFVMAVKKMQVEAACKLMEERAASARASSPFVAEGGAEDGGREESRGDTTTTTKEDSVCSEGSRDGDEEESSTSVSDGKQSSAPAPPSNVSTTTAAGVSVSVPPPPTNSSRSQYSRKKRTYSEADKARAMNELDAKERAELLKMVAKKYFQRHEVCRHVLKVGGPNNDLVLAAKMTWKPRRLYCVLASLKFIDNKLAQLDNLLEIHRASSFTERILHTLMLRERHRPVQGWTSSHDKWLLRRVGEVGWPGNKATLKKLVSTGWPGGCEGVPPETICALNVMKSRLKAIIAMTCKARKLITALPKNPQNEVKPLHGGGGVVENNGVQQWAPGASLNAMQPANKIFALTHVGQKMHVALQRNAEKPRKLNVPEQQEPPKRCVTQTLPPMDPQNQLNLSYVKPWCTSAFQRLCHSMQLLGVPVSLLRHDVESQWVLPYCLVLRGVGKESDPTFVQLLDINWECMADYAKIDNVDGTKNMSIAMISSRMASTSNHVHAFRMMMPLKGPQILGPDLRIVNNMNLLNVSTATRIRQVIIHLGTWEAVLKLCWQLSFVPCVSRINVPLWWYKGYHDAKLLVASVLIGYSKDAPSLFPLLEFQNVYDGRSIGEDCIEANDKMTPVVLKHRLDALRTGVLHWAKSPDHFYGLAHMKAVGTAISGKDK